MGAALPKNALKHACPLPASVCSISFLGKTARLTTLARFLARTARLGTLRRFQSGQQFFQNRLTGIHISQWFGQF
jgi:hypothetical protein